MSRTPKLENGWSEWKNHVLAELERQSSIIEGIDSKVGELKTDIVVLKLKASVWGLLGGSVPVALMIIVEFFKR